jgi:predicted permease
MSKRRNRRRGTDASWIRVIFFIVFFLPLGIYLMLRKLHREVDSYETNGRRVAIVGRILCGLGLLMLLTDLTADVGIENVEAVALSYSNSMLFLIVAIGGYQIERHGQKYAKKGKMNRELVTILNNNLERSVASITSFIEIAYDDIGKEIKRMIDEEI